MLYRTIFLAAGLLATVPLSAQGFSLGFKGGYSLSDLVFHKDFPGADVQKEYPLQPGFHAGVEGRMECGNRFALLVELQYAQKGYVGELYWPTGLAEAHYILNYGTLPVTGSFRIWKGLALQAGVEAAWLFSAQGKSAGETFNPEGIFDLYNDFDLGLIGGLEYQFGKSFFLGARHTFGLRPLMTIELTDENGNSLGPVHGYNGSTQFSAGYRYYFSK